MLVEADLVVYWRVWGSGGFPGRGFHLMLGPEVALEGAAG